MQHVRLIEPHAADEAAVAFEQHGRHVSAARRVPCVAIDDFAADRLHAVRRQFMDGPHLREIEHVARQVKQQIASRVQVEAANNSARTGPTPRTNCIDVCSGSWSKSSVPALLHGIPVGILQ